MINTPSLSAEPGQVHHCVIHEWPDSRRSWEERDRKLVADVERHGWAVIGIEADEGLPGWAFSAGLWHTFGSPEIAIFGLPVRICRDDSTTPANRSAAGSSFVQMSRVRESFRTPQSSFAPLMTLGTASSRVRALVRTATATAPRAGRVARPAWTIPLGFWVR